MKKVSTLVGVIIIVAVAIVAFGGVFAYQYFTKPQTPSVKSQANTDECKSIVDQNQRNVCYRAIAISSKDISICDKIIDRDYSTGKTTYKEDCSIKVKTAMGRCEELDANNGGDGCYIQLAIKNNDVSLCDKVKDIAFRAECFNNFK